jgi:putative sigma-54 modulation protein
MNLNISAKKMLLGQAFVDHAQKKLQKLDRFFGEEGDAKITISPIRGKVTVELTVSHNTMIFRAEQSAEEKGEALDACIDLIIRQIRKNKTKVEKKLKEKAFADSFDTQEDEETGIYEVVKHKQFVLRPMAIEEAILQMNMVGHTFFMFKNAQTGDVNVVYKRDDGNYAVLEPTNG